MITALERDEFIQKIGTWQFLSIEEQENVVSKALERYDQKSRLKSIPNAPGWLLRAAEKIKHEELRERRKRNREVDGLYELRCSDRRTNGSSDERSSAISRSESPPLPTQFEIACRSALEMLPPIDRKIVELCVIDGLYPAEAGRILSLGRSTTKSRLERALQKLRANSTLRQLVGLESIVAGRV